jgi:hypothetical protein
MAHKPSTPATRAAARVILEEGYDAFLEFIARNKAAYAAKHNLPSEPKE